MFERIKDFPVLDTYPSRIPAETWNVWRRYWINAHRETSFTLQGLSPMVLMLSDDAWGIVDASFNDSPVLIWCDFQDQDRTALHEAVPCTVKQYHQGASKVRDLALKLMIEELENRLKVMRRGSGS